MNGVRFLRLKLERHRLLYLKYDQISSDHKNNIIHVKSLTPMADVLLKIRSNVLLTCQVKRFKYKGKTFYKNSMAYYCDQVLQVRADRSN